MSDNLTIFGIDYTGVTGIKATGTGNGTLAYIRPQGTKSISANGTGIDVTAYSTVDVSVPSQESVFVITVSYNRQTQMWEPDCTYAEVAAAYQAGKELVAEGPTIDDMVAADCIWNADQSVLYYMVYFLSSSTQWACRVYSLSSNGIELAWDDSISTPTGTINITASGNTDVADYATAYVPSGTAGTPTATKGTVSNHSVSVTPSVTNSTGYITGGTKTGTAVNVSASELVSGSETKTANGTYDVTNLASVNVALDFVTYYTSSSNPTSSQGSNGDIWLVTS